MKAFILILGVLLISLGAVVLANPAITYQTDEANVDIGPFHATVEEREQIRVPRPVGFVAIAAGAVLLVVGARVNRSLGR